MSNSARVLRYLKHGDRTQAEICSALNLGKGSVSTALRNLKELGCIHIGSFRRGKNNLDAACYRVGQGEDAVSSRRPNNKTPEVEDDGVIPYALLPVWHNHIFTHAGQAPAERF